MDNHDEEVADGVRNDTADSQCQYVNGQWISIMMTPVFYSVTLVLSAVTSKVKYSASKHNHVHTIVSAAFSLDKSPKELHTHFCIIHIHLVALGSSLFARPNVWPSDNNWILARESLLTCSRPEGVKRAS